MKKLGSRISIILLLSVIWIAPLKAAIIYDLVSDVVTLQYETPTFVDNTPYINASLANSCTAITGDCAYFYFGDAYNYDRLLLVVTAPNNIAGTHEFNFPLNTFSTVGTFSAVYPSATTLTITDTERDNELPTPTPLALLALDLVAINFTVKKRH
ncbi:MAG: hypothetical protein ABW090_09435 [Sedimenticola sp.]